MAVDHKTGHPNTGWMEFWCGQGQLLVLLLFLSVEWRTQGISGTEGEHTTAAPLYPLKVQFLPLSLLVSLLLAGSCSSTTDRKNKERKAEVWWGWVSYALLISLFSFFLTFLIYFLLSPFSSLPSFVSNQRIKLQQVQLHLAQLDLTSK